MTSDEKGQRHLNPSQVLEIFMVSIERFLVKWSTSCLRLLVEMGRVFISWCFSFLFVNLLLEPRACSMNERIVNECCMLPFYLITQTKRY